MQESSASVSPTNGSETDLVEKLLAMGTAHVQQQQWKSALTCYQQAIALQPNNGQVQLQLAIVLDRLGEPDAAIEHYFQALLLNSASLSVEDLCRLAELFKQRGQFDRALSCYQWALQQQPSRQMHEQIAELSNRQGQYEAAATHYQQAIELEPNWADYHHLGDVFGKLEQWEAAAQAYRQSIQLNSNFPWSHNNLGNMLVQLQQPDAAIEAYQRAITIDPEFHWAYCNLGELYSKRGDLDKAMACYQKNMVMRGWEKGATRGYRFSHDWFTHNIPNWQEHLKPLANLAVNVLEIGSYEGMATCWMLDHLLTHADAKITCVDLQFQPNFAFNLEQTGASDKVTKLTGDSHQILATLSSESYDLVYIDGCHLADHTRKDALMSWEMLKLGGFMVFDDYEWSDPNCPGQDPKLGIDAFLDDVKPQIEVLHKGYQVITRKTLG